MSDSIDIEYLEQFKADIISEMRKINKRIDNIEQQHQVQLENSRTVNASYVSDIISAVNKSRSRSEISAPVPVVSEINNAGLSDNDLKKILKTFNEGLNNTRDELIQINKDVKADAAKEAAEYNKFFNEKYEELLNRGSKYLIENLILHDEKFHEQLTEDYNIIIDKLQQNHYSFSEQLKVYSDVLAERNAEALENVQKENNQELMSISESLEKQINTHETFIRNCDEFNTGLKADLHSIIEQNNDIVSAFGKAAYENNAHTFELWKQFLNELTDRLDKLEQKNAASFHSAMDDYRERFIEANAEAIKSVQSDIVARLFETQGQLNELTKQTNELGCMIVDICDKIDVFIQGEMNISEERHSNMKKMIDNKLETNNRYTENIRDSIYNLTETIDETIKIVSQNSENYNKAIQLIQENQERMNSLAQEDITILKGLLK